MNFSIIAGDNRDTLKTLEDNSVDAIVTDPPYGIDFLGKDWDANTGAIETYQECLRVLKPGGHILAFSAARTYHHLAITLEQAGFEIRDQIMWLYGSGFPKAHDMGKAIQKRQGVEEYKTHKTLNGYAKEQTAHGAQRVGDVTKEDYENTITETVCTSPQAQQWSGWKTALKPAHEPICMARKPFKGSCIDNVLEHGVGALNIDATRVGDDIIQTSYNPGIKGVMASGATDDVKNKKKTDEKSYLMEPHQGRFPSNVIGEVEDYQKYFYCPKVSRRERHIGFEAPPPEKFNNPEEMRQHPLWDPSIGTNSHRLMKKIREHQAKNPLAHIPNTREMLEQIGGYYCDKDGNATTPDQHTNLAYVPGKGIIQAHGVTNAYEQLTKNKKGNNHPTVKPVALMKYLIKLVTPPNSTVLDPFTGSGSTGMAAVELGHTFIGCELDPDYVNIAETRIKAWNTP